MRLFENHDTDRFVLEEPKSLKAYKQAVTLLLTKVDEPPCNKRNCM